MAISSISRRNLLASGLVTTAAVPFLLGTSEKARAHDSIQEWSAGQRVAVFENEHVVGLSAIRAVGNPIDIPEGNIQDGPLPFNESMIRGLLSVSYSNGDGLPWLDDDRFGDMARQIMSEEDEAFGQLRDAEFYWVQVNPGFLIVPIVREGVRYGIIALIPFVNGFLDELGRRAEDWIVSLFGGSDDE